MKKSKSHGIWATLIFLVSLIGLPLSPAAAASTETLNVAGSVPLVHTNDNDSTRMEEGPVNLPRNNGNEDGRDSNSILAPPLLARFTEKLSAVTAAPDVVEVPPGGTVRVTVSGGIGEYTVSSADDTKAVAVVNGSTISITGLTEGEVVLTVSDGATPANTEEITVTVAGFIVCSVAPGEVTIPEGGSATVTVNCGITPYTAVSTDDAIAAVTVDGNTLTITGVAPSEESIEVIVTDSNPTVADTATVYVTVTKRQPLLIAPSTLCMKIGETGDLNITGGVAPYSVASSDNAVAAVAVVETTVTVEATSEGNATITVTDISGISATAEINVVTGYPVNTCPNWTPYVNYPDWVDIPLVQCMCGGYGTTPPLDPDKFDISVNFPAFAEPVDIWVAVVLPGARLAALFNQENDLVIINLADDPLPVIPPFRVSQTEPVDAVLIPESPICDFLGEPTVPEGTWTVTYIITPANGGVYENIACDNLCFKQTTYTFEISCD